MPIFCATCGKMSRIGPARRFAPLRMRKAAPDAGQRARQPLAREFARGSAQFLTRSDRAPKTAPIRTRCSQFFANDPRWIRPETFLSLPAKTPVDKRSNRFTTEGEPWGLERPGD
jgi:hypothetical protein